jgi:hypothetical protein
VQITNAPRSSGKELAELHDPSHIVSSPLLGCCCCLSQITNAPRSSGKELAELHEAAKAPVAGINGRCCCCCSLL